MSLSRILLAVSFFAPSLLPLATYAQNHPDCDKAIEYYNAANWDKAMFLQQQCISANPADGKAYYNRGRIWFQMKETQKALDDYQYAIKLTPDFIQPYYALSEYYLSNKDMDNSIKWIGGAITARPDIPGNYNFRGWLYFNMNMFQLAFKDFTKAIELDSLNATAYNNRGSARYNIQNVEEASESDLIAARQDYEKAYVLDSTLPNLYRNLGYVEYLLNRHNEALYWLNKAAGRDKDDAMVFYYKGLVLDKLERYGEAINEFDKATALYNRLAEAYLAKGRVLYKKKSFNTALFNINKAVELQPEFSAEGHYLQAMINAQSFEQDKMMEHLKLAEKFGYFAKASHKGAFFKEPAFNDYRKYKPLENFTARLKGF